MKLNKITTLTLMAAALFCTSCVDDDLDGMEAQPKPTATTSVSSLTLAEGESAMIPFTISNALNVPSQFKIELVDGNGTQDDITAGDHATDGDTGIIDDGYEITVPAYATSFDIPVNALLDLDQTEGTETITLKISAAGVRTILTPQDYLVTVSITDYTFCLWTLDATDTYGDSWNGGYIEVTIDGVVSQYASENNDGAVNLSETTSHSITIDSGATYSISYVSGGGTGAGPGWESENEYVLTAPDGTVYSDGPIPTAGVITSGTCL